MALFSECETGLQCDAQQLNTCADWLHNRRHKDYGQVTQVTQVAPTLLSIIRASKQEEMPSGVSTEDEYYTLLSTHTSLTLVQGSCTTGNNMNIGRLGTLGTFLTPFHNNNRGGIDECT